MLDLPPLPLSITIAAPTTSIRIMAAIAISVGIAGATGAAGGAGGGSGLLY